MNSRAVMIIDRDQLFAAALSALLNENGFVIEGPYTTVEAADKRLRTGMEPGLLILDPTGLAGRSIQAPDWTAVLRHVRSIAPQAALVVLTSDMSKTAIWESMVAGARGHLAKSTGLAALRHALVLVGLGRSVYPPEMLSFLSNGPAVTAGGTRELSPREIQILSCLLSGLSNKAIAGRLEVTESTVKMHFKNVLRKIRVANRTQAAIWALEHGIGPMG